MKPFVDQQSNQSFLSQFGARGKIIKEMALLAHHLVFFCEKHYKLEGADSLYLANYIPQTQARHTVDADCLLELETLLKLVGTVTKDSNADRTWQTLLTDAFNLRK